MGPQASVATTRPRRAVRSPTTEPWNWLGHSISTFITGSNSTGLVLDEVLPHRGLGAGLERHVRAVDFVVGAVFDDHVHADDRVAGDGALVDRVAEALFDGGNVFAGDAAADDVFLEEEGFFGVFGQDFHAADDVGVLARAAGLLAVVDVELGRLGWELRGS